MPVALAEKGIRLLENARQNLEVAVGMRPSEKALEQARRISDGTLPITDDMRGKFKQGLIVRVAFIYDTTVNKLSLGSMGLSNNLSLIPEIQTTYQNLVAKINNWSIEETDSQIKARAQEMLDKDKERRSKKKQGAIFP